MGDVSENEQKHGWMDGDLLISQKYQICIWMGPKMGGADTLDICCLQYTQNT